MVQVIQSGPSTATLRQAALNDAIETAIGGFEQIQKTRERKELTARQQAMQDLAFTRELRDAGYDVTPEQVAQAASGGRVDLFAQRSPEYTQKKLLEEQTRKEDRDLEKRLKEEQIAKSKFDREQSIKNEPFRRKKEEAEIAKLSREGGIGDVAKEQSKELAKKTTQLFGVKTAMDSALGQLSNPNLSEGEKIKAGQGLLKLLNSAEGSDAVGAEESKRIGSFLEYSLGNITGPGGFRIGRDLDAFTEQVKNYRDLLQDRIVNQEAGISALGSGGKLSNVVPSTATRGQGFALGQVQGAGFNPSRQGQGLIPQAQAGVVKPQHRDAVKKMSDEDLMKYLGMR